MRRKSRKKVKKFRQRDGFSRERRLRIEARKMVGTMGLDSFYGRYGNTGFRVFTRGVQN